MTIDTCDYCSIITSEIIICKSKMRRLIGLCESCQDRVDKFAKDLYDSGVH